MKIALITLFPNMFEAISEYGISGRAVKNGLVELACFNPRDFTEDKHRTVDDRPYGGGPGMVMLVEPLRKAIDAAREWIEGQPIVVYLSPQGMVLNQSAVNKFAEQKSLILIAGRYVIPTHTNNISRLAHVKEIKFPDHLPMYGDWIGFLPDVWWFDPN